MSEGVQFLTISAEEAGQRLDNFLLRILKRAPKSLVYRIIRKGEVRINKGRASPDRKLEAGDVVRVPPVKLDIKAEEALPSDSLSEFLTAAVIYEDAGLIVVNKPSGLAVHGGSGINLGLVEALRQIRNEPTLELAHRLDRETSGCIVLAKKRSTLRLLHDCFRESGGHGAGGIDKQYLALVKGAWSKRKLSVDAPLKKNELASGERIVKVDQDGKPSKTLFQLEQCFQDCSLVRASPLTGRTHQIRVHAQYQGHPLVGDDKYGDDEFNNKMRLFGFKRLFLHAARIRFSLENGTRVDVEAPLPDDLLKALNNLPTG